MLLKSTTIKSTTKRVLKELFIALDKFMEENPSMSTYTILNNLEFHNRLTIRNLRGKAICPAGIVIGELPDDSGNDAYTLLCLIVWRIVRFELSYDPTMGTEKDLKTTVNFINEFIGQLKSLRKKGVKVEIYQL